MSNLLVAFRYGDTRLFARLVCLIRGGDSAHCEAAAPQDLETRLDPAASGALFYCVSSSWVDGGPRPVTMRLPPSKWRIYETDLSAERADEWLAEQRRLGYIRYGWWKLIRFLFPFIRPSRGGPICTEAIAAMVDLGHTDSWDLRTLEAAIAWRYRRVQ